MTKADRELVAPALVVLLAASLILFGGEPGAMANSAFALLLLLPLVATWVIHRRGPSALQYRARLGLLYVWALGLYLSIEWIIPAAGRPLVDEALLSADQALFGQTPSLSWTPGRAAVSLLSLCYMGYHAYLHGALLWAGLDEGRSERLGRPLFRTFALGHAGYLLWPAQGPASLGLFDRPLGGGPITRALDLLIGHGSSVFDAFPSMHTAITLVLLVHDWQHARRRFWVILGPALGLFVSTVALRYHYGVDVMAGVVVAAVVLGAGWLERRLA